MNWQNKFDKSYQTLKHATSTSLRQILFFPLITKLIRDFEELNQINKLNKSK